MKEAITDSTGEQPDPRLLFDDWIDPIEACVRERVRGFIEAMIEEELAELLGRSGYARHGDGGRIGHRHGHRSRQLTGTFGTVDIAVPRARLDDGIGRTKEWRSQPLRAYQRRTQAADALIASTYLARDQQPAGSSRIGCRIRWRGRQGRRQSRVAQGENRLGGLEHAQPCRRGHRSTDPGRHGGASENR